MGCTKDSVSDIDNSESDDDTPTVPVDEQAEISPRYVDLKDIKPIECDFKEDNYTFELNSGTKKLKRGSVIIVTDESGKMEIVIVDQVKTEGNAVKVNGVDGALCDIFANTEFVLSTSGLTRSTPGSAAVYTPSKVEYETEDGTFVDITGQTRADYDGTTHFTGKLWKWNTEYLTEDERTLYESKNAKVYFSKADVSIDLDIDVVLSFGGRNPLEYIDNYIKQYRSQALWCESYITGSYNNNLELASEISGSAKYQEKEDELVKHNLLRPFRITFAGPYGVPIQVSVSANMFRGASIEASGKLQAKAGVTSRIAVKGGLKWEQAGTVTPIKEFEKNTEFIPPTVTGQGAITGKVWMYPRIYVMVYETMGPSFDIIPYLGTQLSGGFGVDAAHAKDYFAYNLRNFVGMDFDAGLSTKMMNYEVGRVSLGRANIFEFDIFQSPSDIQLIGQSTPDAIPLETTTLVFEVCDVYPVTNTKLPTILPQVVRFEATGGTLSQPFALAVGGKVSVDWTPEKNTDMMSAILYSADGSVISKASFGCEEVMPTEGQAVDLGLSVLWASHNVGASRPEGYGSYFAWGETTPKRYFTKENYKFYEKCERCKENSVDVSCEKCFKNIGNDISGTGYDAARAKWGKGWRMPTYSEIDELRSCEFKQTTYNGVKGTLIIGHNGNSIFVPQAGEYYSNWNPDLGPYHSSAQTAFWGSTYDSGGWPSAYCFDLGHSTANRTHGLPIRPVKDKKQ